jgi:hypothetical protein
MRSVHLRTLFEEDPSRAERFTVEAAGLYVDYSKHRITAETLARLVALAEAARLRERIDAMMRGDRINVTENRPGPSHRPARAEDGIHPRRWAQRRDGRPRRAGSDVRISPTACEAESGRASPASAFAPS